MPPGFNFRHLHYFWVVGHAGGMTRAAEQLGAAVQTVSAQVRALERDLGTALLAPSGRGLRLTPAGSAVLRQADQIFQLGEQLPALARGAATVQGPRLAVGVSDGLPKLVVHRLLAPVLAVPGLRLACHEGEMAQLLAELALHQLDVLLADRPAPASPNLRLYSHALGRSAIGWYAPPVLAAAARAGFPRSLAELPVLLPTGHAAVRAPLDQWFERLGVQPRIVGEFEDSALLKTFGAAGMGLFPAPLWVHDDLSARDGVQRVGEAEGVEERFFAVGTQRKITHPLVRRLLPEGAV